MKRLKLAVAALIIAITTFYYAAIRLPDVAEQEDDANIDDEIAQPISPAYAVPSVYDSMKDELETRKQAALIAAKQRRIDAIAKEHVEAERRKKAKVQAESKRQVPVSRGSSYVGQAQSFESTFYTAKCPTGCTGITSSGYDVRNTIYYGEYRILAAPPSIPLYSILRVTLADGTKFDGIVLDRGGDIGEGRLDILVKSRDEAYRLGRQTVEVRFLRRGK
ncbi:3D domain-containing protein [Sporosarcina koreensis]|uniref:3D domain-containing protein n=1 Tax=Sporosarcina koreensis TaxID=334735 RepID=UPI0007545F3B|nr:3D domain-containing protein [Sporosarcina koreensis]